MKPRPRKPGLKLSLWDRRPSGKSRGGTPRGERAALCARRTPKGCGSWTTRLSAFRFLAFFERVGSSEIANRARSSFQFAIRYSPIASFLPIVRLQASTAGILWRRSVRRARKSVLEQQPGCKSHRGNEISCPHPEERVARLEGCGATCFETHCCAMLLSMRT